MCSFGLAHAATLTLVLVACAGWMIGSVYLLLHQPLGFGPKRLLRAHATFGSNHPPKARARFYRAQATSMPVLLGSTLLLLVPALIAIGLPASRAALQDPADTLRRE